MKYVIRKPLKNDPDLRFSWTSEMDEYDGMIVDDEDIRDLEWGDDTFEIIKDRAFGFQREWLKRYDQLHLI